MATDAVISQISEIFDNCSIEKEDSSSSQYSSSISEAAEYGLPLKEVYKLAFNFYKGITNI